jgi:beta-phosphoglucomutase
MQALKKSAFEYTAFNYTGFYHFWGYMDWISQFQLFLFDLDGLLVNTEEIHFNAYKVMLKNRGYNLTWDFPKYFSIAQQDAEAPKRYIYSEFPKLQQEEPAWSVLYAEKKHAYLDLLEQKEAPMLPGAEKLLLKLQELNVKRAVVTHSGKSLVDALCHKNPTLRTIPNWITREDYVSAKPAPDGYLKAIELLATDDDRVIGFEDSSRGLRALMATRATPVLVNSHDDVLCQTFSKQGVQVFTSLEEVYARL